MLLSVLVLLSNSINAQILDSGNKVTLEEVAYCTRGLSYAPAGYKRARSIQKKIVKNYNRMLQSTVDIGVPATGASGVIISQDGYILTAAHVIEALGGKDGEIRLYDGTTVEAACLGRNKNADYGLLKIKGKRKWTYAELGTSSDLVMDETCIMLGHPEIYDPKRPAVIRVGFYKGITSYGYLKTSCIMMPGDSGGPLFDLAGKVIGVCSYIKDGINENYYPSIDKVKENWDRLEFAEIFDDEGTQKEAKFTKAPNKESPFMLEDGKEGLRKIIEAQTENLGKSVLKVESKSDSIKLVAYATRISSTDYFVSKSSRVSGKDLICEFGSGEQFKGKVVGRDEASDLVVVKMQLEEDDLFYPLEFKKDIEIEAGKLLGTINSQGKVIHSGIVSVGAREVSYTDKGYLGVGFDSSKPIVGTISKGTPAEKGGLLPGDQLLKFNTSIIESRQDVYGFLKTTHPGQKVTIKVSRANEERELAVLLGKSVKELSDYEKQHPAYRTKEHERSDGFPNAFTHDMPLLLDEVGTPVVNLEGEIIGINIARKNRTSSFAIPLSSVLISVKSILSESGITTEL